MEIWNQNKILLWDMTDLWLVCTFALNTNTINKFNSALFELKTMKWYVWSAAARFMDISHIASSITKCFLYYPPLSSSMFSEAVSMLRHQIDFSWGWFLHVGLSSHEQNIVHPSWEQLQEAVLHPDVLQLQGISRSISGGIDSVSGCTVRGSTTPWWSTSET